MIFNGFLSKQRLFLNVWIGLLGLLPILACAQETPESLEDEPVVYYSLSLYGAQDLKRLGLEASRTEGLYDGAHRAFRTSLNLFWNQNKQNEHQLYWGIGAAGFLYANYKILYPMIGVGLFAGDSTQFEEGNLALYPEVGMVVEFRKIHAYPFLRRHFDLFGDKKVANSLGLSMGISF